MPHSDQSPQGFPLFSTLLAIVALGVIVVGFVYLSDDTATEPETVRPEVAERLRAVSAVHAGASGAAAVAAAEAERKAQTAAAGPADGQTVFNNVCSACHGTGVGGAPKLEKAAWNARLAKGVDTLVSNAINGFQGEAGVMPARGGGSSLSDAEVEGAVKWMLDNLK